MLQFLTNHWSELLLLATVAARITPTKRDDEITSKVGKVLKFIFLASKEKK